MKSIVFLLLTIVILAFLSSNQVETKWIKPLSFNDKNKSVIGSNFQIINIPKKSSTTTKKMHVPDNNFFYFY
ncbi:unnamed protein product [Brachionus calyciflorus]|uniref:Uncharacterized protein n=1 Tax=Brachionus calyciflorus TaxID=104777 RepID=A0A813PS45_9BILA|nr:unnamed protein product [Brachionus calyciflorus]